MNEFKHQTPEHYSCGVICFCDGKILVVYQTNGHWSFPKGTQEAGESDVETALRELEEETGITAVKLDENFCHRERYLAAFPSGKKLKQVTYFLGDVENVKLHLDPEEIKDARWLSPDDALERLTYEETKDTLHRALTYKELL